MFGRKQRLALRLAGALLFVVVVVGAETGEAVEFDQTNALQKSQAVIGTRPGEHGFLDRSGRRILLSTYRGKPLLVNFAYSGCFQVCPATVRMLAKSVASAQRALGSEAFHVITIGFNLPFDTPQAMADFALRHGATYPNWEFLSPDDGDVEALTREFGFTYRATQGGFDHLTQVTLVSADGTILRQIYGENFELPLLVEPLRQLAAGEPARFDLAQVMEKVRLVCTVYDPVSGRYRFSYTIFIEIFAGLSIIGGGLLFLFRGWRRGSGVHGT